MAETNKSGYVEKYAKEAITFSPYICAKLGLIQAQTLLILGDYRIICTPYQLSFSRIIALGVLSKDEILFFRKYLKGLCSLSLAFTPPGGDKSTPISMLIRGSLEQMGPLKGKDKACLFCVTPKSVPNHLITLIGSYLDGQKRLQLRYNQLKGTVIPFAKPGVAKLAGYNQWMELITPKGPSPAVLIAGGVDSLRFRVRSDGVLSKQGDPFAAKLFFRKYRFTVKGVVLSVTAEGDSADVQGKILYSPEFTEIIDDMLRRIKK
ncbi:MAG: hypothetical protein ACLFST_08630 [Spirochaetia bacterium]